VVAEAAVQGDVRTEASVEWLTTEEVAEMMRVSSRQVIRLTDPESADPLPCLNLSPRVWRFRRDRVLAWMERQTPAARSELGTRNAEGGMGCVC
jgi:hypothetical protein